MSISLILGLAALTEAQELLDYHDTTRELQTERYSDITEDDGWAYVLGKGKRSHYSDATDVSFRGLVEAGCMNADKSDRFCIIRRFCDSCSSNDHVDIYYKRLTPIPPIDKEDFLDLFLNNWFDTPNNALHVDFELYSTLEDAIWGKNEWKFCNYNDGGVGFPRDCGPNRFIGGQWNSYVRGGGTADSHAFYVEMPPEMPEMTVNREEVQAGKRKNMLHAALLAALGRDPTDAELDSSLKIGHSATMRAIRRRGGHLANDSYAEKRWRSAKYVNLRKELRQKRQAARKLRRGNH